MSDNPQQEISKNPRAVVRTAEMHYSGPLPPPSALEKYDQILPGSAERILQMAEKAQSHAHKMDTE